jgi:hypothetical protein
LITNVSEYAAPDVNLNIRPGLCRPVDLTKPPFNVRGKTIFEYYGDGQKSVFLWQRD